jgi:GT2 family glycosyltransferase
MAGLPLPTKPVSVEAISGAFMLVRRSALEAVGPMDDGYFLHCEDIDWCMRFRAIGLKILFVPYISIIHWKGFSSTARPIRVELHKHRGMIRFYYKFFRHQYPGILMYIVVVAVWLRFFAKAFLLMLKTPLRIGRPRWTKWRSG